MQKPQQVDFDISQIAGPHEPDQLREAIRAVQGRYQAAAAGNREAQIELAEWWCRTVGFAPAAFPWYLKAAIAGSGVAARQVAFMYLAGKGVEESPPLAMHWGLIAILRGEREAVGVVNAARSVLTPEERLAILSEFRKRHFPE
jgi:TPR repeat protein